MVQYANLARRGAVVLTCLLISNFAFGDNNQPRSNSFAGTLDPAKADIYFQPGGISSHARQTRAPGRHWQEGNPGIGFEQRVDGLPWEGVEALHSPWQSRYSIGSMKDSRGFWGGYAGVAAMYELTHLGTARVDAGVGAFILYRSTSWKDNGHRSFVPALLPAISMTDQRTGLGLNIIWLPPISKDGKDRPSTLFFQFTYRM